MSPSEPMWALAGRDLTRDLRATTSKDELLQHIQAIWNYLPQADIQRLFDYLSRRIAQHLLQRVVAAPNTDFGTLNIVFVL
ncbi:hypothetical protein TNCV_5060271 [Trichonephila clavipes]|nr:hypothetical protein TNCV_5060271 [Trichonephila clavipes]